MRYLQKSHRIAKAPFKFKSKEVSQMMTFNEIFSKISTAFTSSTGTGLDVLNGVQPEERIAMELFANDTIPATTNDIANAYLTVLGHEASVEDLLDTENYLLAFGWLR